MAKPKLNPLDNSLHSELFFLVLTGKNYAQLISKIQEKTPAIVIRQLNDLLQEGLLQKKKEARLNKTIYSIDWNAMIKLINKTHNFLIARRAAELNIAQAKNLRAIQKKKTKRLRVSTKMPSRYEKMFLDEDIYVHNKIIINFVKKFFESYLAAIISTSVSTSYFAPLNEILKQFLISINLIYSINERPNKQDNINFKDKEIIKKYINSISLSKFYVSVQMLEVLSWLKEDYPNL